MAPTPNTLVTAAGLSGGHISTPGACLTLAASLQGGSRGLKYDFLGHSARPNLPLSYAITYFPYSGLMLTM